ncbi:MAG: polysaccharide deacetylase family protein, partial [Bacteroidota bacterium]
FDDGPDPVNTPRILDTLDQHGIKAIFFVIGKTAESFPSVLREIDARGHTIGNHSYSHRYLLPFYRVRSLLKDFNRSATVIEQAIGKRPLLIRPPFGVTSPRYYGMLLRKKFTSIGWSLRSLDTVASNRADLIQRVTKKLRPGAGQILLLHDNRALTADALPELIARITESGINIVTPAEALTVPFYE